MEVLKPAIEERTAAEHQWLQLIRKRRSMVGERQDERLLRQINIGMNWRKLIGGMQLALRAASAAGASVAIAHFFGLNPIYAFLAAVIVTDLSPAQSRRLGWHRVIATVVGAVCGAILCQVFPPSAVGIGLSILIAMLACQLVQSSEGAKVAGFTCAIVVLQNSPEPWLNACFRLVETIIGVVTALLISYVPKLIKIGEPSEKAA
jgi:uncharacterized membrane protein YgaE (UPF0421/DUF939 family)